MLSEPSCYTNILTVRQISTDSFDTLARSFEDWYPSAYWIAHYDWFGFICPASQMFDSKIFSDGPEAFGPKPRTVFHDMICRKSGWNDLMVKNQTYDLPSMTSYCWDCSHQFKICVCYVINILISLRYLRWWVNNFYCDTFRRPQCLEYSERTFMSVWTFISDKTRAPWAVAHAFLAMSQQ